MFCPECGKEVKEGVDFCPECGKKIGEVEKPLIDERKDTGIKMLFDSSFDKFLSLRIIRVLYKFFIFLSVAGGIVVFLMILVPCLRYGSADKKIGGIILGPIAGFLTFLFSLVLFRIWSETMIILFKIAEDVSSISRKKTEK